MPRTPIAQARTLMVLALPALALMVLARAAGPAWAADCPDNTPRVSVSGQAYLEIAPDRGRLVVGVTNQTATADEAARANAAAMDKVTAAVKAKLGPQDKLRTVGYFLSPRNEWDNNARRYRKVGYQASNRLEIISSQPQTLGNILDAAVAAGANEISGPSWLLSNPAEARRQAQETALADARSQAQALAQAAGLSLGRVLKIEVGGGDPVPAQALALRAPSLAAAAAPETSLEPGVVKVQARMLVVYGLSGGQ